MQSYLHIRARIEALQGKEKILPKNSGMDKSSRLNWMPFVFSLFLFFFPFLVP
jgi:hypothetical protein